MAEPYYKDEFVALYHGDCLEVEEWQSADVLVTDPPYGMAYKSNWGANHGFIQNDESVEIRNRTIEAWGDKPALVFGTWRVAKPNNIRNTIIWDKSPDPGMGDLSSPWGSSHEEIYVLGRGFVGDRRPNVIQHSKINISKLPNHPTPKPTGLMEKLIVCCPPEWVIADPFAGSGATLIAARNLARFAIGVEIDEQYCELIANRLSQAVFQFDF